MEIILMEHTKSKLPSTGIHSSKHSPIRIPEQGHTQIKNKKSMSSKPLQKKNDRHSLKSPYCGDELARLERSYTQPGFSGKPKSNQENLKQYRHFGKISNAPIRLRQGNQETDQGSASKIPVRDSMTTITTVTQFA